MGKPDKDKGQTPKPRRAWPMGTLKTTHDAGGSYIYGQMGNYIVGGGGRDNTEAAALALRVLPECVAILKHPCTKYVSGDFHSGVKDLLARIDAANFALPGQPDDPADSTGADESGPIEDEDHEPGEHGQ